MKLKTKTKQVILPDLNSLSKYSRLLLVHCMTKDTQKCEPWFYSWQRE